MKNIKINANGTIIYSLMTFVGSIVMFILIAAYILPEVYRVSHLDYPHDKFNHELGVAIKHILRVHGFIIFALVSLLISAATTIVHGIYMILEKDQIDGKIVTGTFAIALPGLAGIPAIGLTRQIDKSKI